MDRPHDPRRPPPSILAVDDDATIRRLIERSLRDEGYDMHVCPSAEAALGKLREQAYSVAILDVIMGGETGFALARRIRAGECGAANRDVPIVFVTAEADESSYEQSFDVGAYRYITKPFDPEALVEVVHAMLHGT